jgi:type I restriction enzyme S subunit
MNETLEAMARAVFKSWFVDFDPVRARVEGREPAGMDAETAALFPDGFEEYEGQMLPKGWHLTTIADAVEIHDSKRVPLSNRQRTDRPGPYPYYGAASAMDYIDDFLFDGSYVLVGEDGSVIKEDGTPVIQYVWGKIWVNNHAHVLSGKNGISVEHLLLFFQQINIKPFVTGAVQPKLNQANLCRIPFFMPPSSICQEFDIIIEPLYKMIRINIEQSYSLSEIRDSLLPKLLSGKKRMKDLFKAEKACI